jgi:hypothetical protein
MAQVVEYLSGKHKAQYWQKKKKEMFKGIKLWTAGHVICVYNSSTWEAEAGGSWVWGHPGLNSETVSNQNKQPGAGGSRL